MSITDLITYRKLEYIQMKPVRCPLLGDALIYFNKDGFFHLTHNGRGHIRSEANQRMRLNLLPDVTTVIENARVFGSPTRLIPANANKRHKPIIFYELFYRFNQRKAVSVIIRQVGNGRPHYYSVRYSKGVKSPKKRP